MTFKVGERAVHPSHGVGVVTHIEIRDIGGSNKEFYVLETTDRGRASKVLVATEAAERIGLRKIITLKDAKRVYDVLKATDVAVKAQPWNRRQREYTKMLNSGSPFEVAKVLRDLSRIRGSKELSLGERRLLEHAQSLVVTELAIAQKTTEERVEAD
ncbi:MAG: CarD family transcriptional regulator, partial [Myxococcales bacterium]|nr:CarD family transcriptional regulator [Myxococcales bacterium]